MPWRRLHKPGGNYSKKGQIRKISTWLKETKQSNTQKKYQMQSIDHLIDAVALYISERRNSPGMYWFSNIDLKYAYSLIPLDESIANHCNFAF